MGWCSGSHLAEELYDEIRKYIPEEERKKVAEFIYDKFCDYDADDWSFSNLIKDAGLKSICPVCKYDVWKEDLINGVCEDCYEPEES